MLSSILYRAAIYVIISVFCLMRSHALNVSNSSGGSAVGQGQLVFFVCKHERYQGII